MQIDQCALIHVMNTSVNIHSTQPQTIMAVQSPLKKKETQTTTNLCGAHVHTYSNMLNVIFIVLDITITTAAADAQVCHQHQQSEH